MVQRLIKSGKGRPNKKVRVELSRHALPDKIFRAQKKKIRQYITGNIYSKNKAL